MRFVAIMTDKPNTQDLRAQNYDAHRAFIDANRSAIVLSGPMKAEEGGPARGGLWVIEADSKSAAEAIIHNDPFYKVGLRGSVEVYHWGAAGKIG